MKVREIYYEEAALEYELGRQLRDKFYDVKWIPIDNHNNIPEMRSKSNSEFVRMKQNLIVGVRKTHKYVENHKTSDFLVPYTSSGCSAACLYCYLVCNYNKCSYLRLFVNREQMLDKLIKTAEESDRDLTFEIGSNSDLILENTITENLCWTIPKFAKSGKGYITFPTKFDMVDPLLSLDHGGRTVVRMSVNPEEVIREVEFGTSPLYNRIKTINVLKDAGYRTGLLIAPVIMVPNWKSLYTDLLDILSDTLSDKVKGDLNIEVIFMTYSYIHRKINSEAFPNALELYNQEIMTGRGRGKYCYNQQVHTDGERFLREEIEKRFGRKSIAYIV